LIEGEPGVDPVGIQSVPSLLEALPGGSQDALGERLCSPVEGLLHVYRDRVLLLPTGECAVNCRHCNRRWTRRKIPRYSPELVREWVAYLASHPEVEEVLVSGGDPLTLPEEAIEDLLAQLRTVRHLGVVRIGSRFPAVAPERVTERRARVLARFHPVYLNTQFNCFSECTAEAARALAVLADVGVVLGNQMVLLKGVNDSVEAIERVNRWLVRQRCRPYYLFLAEPVAGTMHLRVPVERAVAIAQELRRRLSGISLPRVVVDTPDGGGKISLEPSSLVQRAEGWSVTDNKGRTVLL